jgi:hypothetical protein
MMAFGDEPQNVGTGFQEQTLPAPGPPKGIDALRTGELEEGIRPDYWETFGSQMKLNWEKQAPTLNLAKLAADYSMESEREAAGKKKLSADEANKLYPGLPQPFNEAVFHERAQQIYDENQRQKRMEDWIGRGPRLGMLANLAAGAAVEADPINLAINLMGGRLVKMLRLPPGFKSELMLNIGGNLASNVPGLIQQSKMQQDPNIAESSAYAVAGAVAGTTVFTLIGKAFAKMGIETPAGTMEANLKTAVTQLERGQRVDVSPTVRTQVLRAAGAVESEAATPYVHAPLEKASDRPLYGALDAETDRPVALAGKDMGPGTTFVDNAGIANNRAADVDNVATGKVVQATLPEDTKLLDLDKTLDSPEGAAFKSAVEKRLGESIAMPENHTINDMLEQLGVHEGGDRSSETWQQAYEVAKELGYDGYQSVQRVEGEPVANAVHVFDPEKVQQMELFDAQPERVPTADEAERAFRADTTKDPAKSPYADQDAEISKIKQEKPEVSPEGLDAAQHFQAEQAMTTLKELAPQDPEADAALRGLREQKALDEREAQLVMDFTLCKKGDQV